MPPPRRRLRCQFEVRWGELCGVPEGFDLAKLSVDHQSVPKRYATSQPRPAAGEGSDATPAPLLAFSCHVYVGKAVNLRLMVASSGDSGPGLLRRGPQWQHLASASLPLDLLAQRWLPPPDDVAAPEAPPKQQQQQQQQPLAAAAFAVIAPGELPADEGDDAASDLYTTDSLAAAATARYGAAAAAAEPLAAASAAGAPKPADDAAAAGRGADTAAPRDTAPGYGGEGGGPEEPPAEPGVQTTRVVVHWAPTALGLAAGADVQQEMVVTARILEGRGPGLGALGGLFSLGSARGSGGGDVASSRGRSASGASSVSGTGRSQPDLLRLSGSGAGTGAGIAAEPLATARLPLAPPSPHREQQQRGQQGLPCLPAAACARVREAHEAPGRVPSFGPWVVGTGEATQTPHNTPERPAVGATAGQPWPPPFADPGAAGSPGPLPPKPPPPPPQQQQQQQQQPATAAASAAAEAPAAAAAAAGAAAAAAAAQQEAAAQAAQRGFLKLLAETLGSSGSLESEAALSSLLEPSPAQLAAAASLPPEPSAADLEAFAAAAGLPINRAAAEAAASRLGAPASARGSTAGSAGGSDSGTPRGQREPGPAALASAPEATGGGRGATVELVLKPPPTGTPEGGLVPVAAVAEATATVLPAGGEPAPGPAPPLEPGAAGGGVGGGDAAVVAATASAAAQGEQQAAVASTILMAAATPAGAASVVSSQLVDAAPAAAVERTVVLEGRGQPTPPAGAPGLAPVAAPAAAPQVPEGRAAKAATEGPGRPDAALAVGRQRQQLAGSVRPPPGASVAQQQGPPPSPASPLRGLADQYNLLLGDAAAPRPPTLQQQQQQQQQQQAGALKEVLQPGPEPLLESLGVRGAAGLPKAPHDEEGVDALPVAPPPELVAALAAARGPGTNTSADALAAPAATGAAAAAVDAACEVCGGAAPAPAATREAGGGLEGPAPTLTPAAPRPGAAPRRQAAAAAAAVQPALPLAESRLGEVLGRKGSLRPAGGSAAPRAYTGPPALAPAFTAGAISSSVQQLAATWALAALLWSVWAAYEVALLPPRACAWAVGALLAARRQPLSEPGAAGQAAVAPGGATSAPPLEAGRVRNAAAARIADASDLLRRLATLAAAPLQLSAAVAAALLGPWLWLATRLVLEPSSWALAWLWRRGPGLRGGVAAGCSNGGGNSKEALSPRPLEEGAAEASTSGSNGSSPEGASCSGGAQRASWFPGRAGSGDSSGGRSSSSLSLSRLLWDRRRSEPAAVPPTPAPSPSDSLTAGEGQPGQALGPLLGRSWSRLLAALAPAPSLPGGLTAGSLAAPAALPQVGPREEGQASRAEQRSDGQAVGAAADGRGGSEAAPAVRPGPADGPSEQRRRGWWKVWAMPLAGEAEHTAAAGDQTAAVDSSPEAAVPPAPPAANVAEPPASLPARAAGLAWQLLALLAAPGRWYVAAVTSVMAAGVDTVLCLVELAAWWALLPARLALGVLALPYTLLAGLASRLLWPQRPSTG